MRRTVTLEPDSEALMRDLMARENIGFKEAINRVIRQALDPRPQREFRQRTFPMGFRPDVPYERALERAGDLEDGELGHQLSPGH